MGADKRPHTAGVSKSKKVLLACAMFALCAFLVLRSTAPAHQAAQPLRGSHHAAAVSVAGPSQAELQAAAEKERVEKEKEKAERERAEKEQEAREQAVREACGVLDKHSLPDAFDLLVKTPGLVGPERASQIGRGACSTAYEGTICDVPYVVSVPSEASGAHCTDSHRAHQAALLQKLAPVARAHPGAVPEFYSFDAKSEAIYQSRVHGRPLSVFPTPVTNITDFKLMAISAFRLVQAVQNVGVVHGAISSSNVLFKRVDGVPSVAFIDFSGVSTPDECKAEEKLLEKQWSQSLADAEGEKVSSQFRFSYDAKFGARENLYFWQGPCPNDVTNVARQLAALACPNDRSLGRKGAPLSLFGYCTPAALRSAAAKSVLRVLADALSPDFPARLRDVDTIVAALQDAKTLA